MKPTHGLVPYTGAMPIEATIDHLGPMTGTVADNALLLEVIAGPDGLDPRQYNVRVDKYTAALGRGVAGLRIGVLTEGFRFESCEPDVVQKVRQAAERLRSLGAVVEEVSIPMHVDGLPIWTPIALEGLVAQMMHGNGMPDPSHNHTARINECMLFRHRSDGLHGGARDRAERRTHRSPCGIKRGFARSGRTVARAWCDR